VIDPVQGQKPPPPFPEGPERDAFSAQAFNDASDRLAEAESLSPEKHGRSIAHCCYYCLFWLARSVLIKHDGTYPWRHDSTESLFGTIIAAAADKDLAEAYALYRDVAAERTICDYESSYRPSPERVVQVLDGTRRAFEIMTRKFDLKNDAG
jgi:HEPN domain